MYSAGDQDAPTTRPLEGSRADGRTVRWVKHRDDRRATLVAAGAEAIDRFGPEANASQIAEVAGVSRTVLYRYFSDKQDLERAIATHIVQNVLATFTPLIALDETSTPMGVIGSAVQTVISFLETHANQYLFLLQRRANVGDAIAEVETNLAAQVAGLLKFIVAFLGMDETHAEAAAFTVVGLVEASAAWWIAERKLTSEQMIAFISNSVWFVLDGHLRTYGRELDPYAPFGHLAAR